MIKERALTSTVLEKKKISQRCKNQWFIKVLPKIYLSVLWKLINTCIIIIIVCTLLLSHTINVYSGHGSNFIFIFLHSNG